MLRARLSPLRVPDDGEALDRGEMRIFLALAASWKDKAGSRALAAAERATELRAQKAARRT
jgi:hypothetical protein